MGKRRRERDFQILEFQTFTRRKSVVGHLYRLHDEEEGDVLVYTDYLKHSQGCTCTERDPRYLCAHIKFIERTRKTLPSLPNPMATQYVGSTAIVIDESRMIEGTLG